MEVILSEDQNSELKSPEAGALEVKQPDLAPGEALKLVFSEYAANTQRAYARAFRDLQIWANIKELQELESFDPLRILEYKNLLKLPPPIDLLIHHPPYVVTILIQP